MKIIYLNSDDSFELKFDTVAERNDLILHHENKEILTLEQFQCKFNSGFISDQGYILIVE